MIKCEWKRFQKKNDFYRYILESEVSSRKNLEKVIAHEEAHIETARLLGYEAGPFKYRLVRIHLVGLGYRLGYNSLVANSGLTMSQIRNISDYCSIRMAPKDPSLNDYIQYYFFKTISKIIGAEK